MVGVMRRLGVRGRLGAMRDRRAMRRQPAPGAEPATGRRMAELERRLAHLEAALEGLQDAVHRDAVRHEAQIQELVRATQPEMVARALTDDARRRGL